MEALYKMTVYAQQLADNNTGISNMVNSARGNLITNMPEITITRVAFKLRRVGDNAGNLSCRIGTVIQPNGAYIKQFDSVVAKNDLPIGKVWHNFYDSFKLPSAGDYRFYIFSDTNENSPTNMVEVMQFAPHLLGNDFRKTTANMLGVFTNHELNYYVMCFVIEYSVVKPRSQALVIG